jgi:predicted dehydrogenase
LDVPYDDTFLVTLEHVSGAVGTLQVDVVCRRAVRDFELSGEDGYLTWDGSPNGVRKLDLASGEMGKPDLYADIIAEHRDGYAAFIVENAYQSELEAFFAEVLDGTKPAYGFEEDLKTLEWIDVIEGVKR